MKTTSREMIAQRCCQCLSKDEGRVHDLGRRTKPKEVAMDFIRELISLITVFASYVESPGNGPEKKEKVKQMIKDALPDEQWKIDPEFFDFILDVLIDLVVMFLNKGLWKTAMKVLVK